jgi:hypothetical protein
MRFSMGILQNRHRVHFVRRKVPKGLQEAVAKVLGNGKARQTFLQQSLKTKDGGVAKKRAPAVLMHFDGVLARARMLAEEQPFRTTLSQAEIERMGEYHFALLLHRQDASVRRGPEQEREFRYYTELEKQSGYHDDEDLDWGDPIPKYGLSGGQMTDVKNSLAELIPEAEAALARGDIEHVELHIKDTLEAFHIRLDHDSEAYKRLGMEILRQDVLALRAWEERSRGEPIQTPRLPVVGTPPAAGTGDALSTAFAGWQKARNPATGTLAEYDRAIRLFIELHGDMPVAEIKRRHARQFVEALQDLPRHRPGNLQRAPLPELTEWGKAHPEAPRLSEGTINKLVGGVQALRSGDTTMDWSPMR